MDMNAYLVEIEYSASGLIDLIWGEQKRIGELKAEIDKLTPVVEDNYRRAEFIQQFGEDIDDVMLGVGMQFENYFGDDKKLHEKNQDLIALQAQLATHQYSIASLSGSLLQNAKQGISIVYGVPGVRGIPVACPDGRTIGTQPLKTVIWESRNQTMHWEEGSLRAAPEAAFQALIADFGVKFSDYLMRDMAFEVVELLGWTSFTAFETDMLTLQ